MSAILLVVLGVVWVALLLMTFHAPDAPQLSRLALFQLLLLVTFILGYIFLVNILRFDPNPSRVWLARLLMDDKFIYLGDIVPGLLDLTDTYRIDTDWADEEIKDEWLAFYQYDVMTPDRGAPQGPVGGAIYDYNECRPPAILSYELVPVSYDYLGEQAATVVIEEILDYSDPLSAGENRPEVIVNGRSRGVTTDLNIFRKVGVGLSCSDWQEWQVTHPGQPFPNPFRYENIGSFRGNHSVGRNGSTIVVRDRVGFERSQFVAVRQYRPQNGSYFRPGTQVLLDPVEYSLVFGTGTPDEVTQVYYPEKAVLAFYLNLGKDKQKLEVAQKYLRDDMQRIYDMNEHPFGLSMADDSVAKARERLARVLVWEIRYHPDVEAEQLHKDRQVTVVVTGVNEKGQIDYDHPCEVTWTVVGVPKSGAQPFGCEWRLDSYTSTCPGSVPKEGGP
jgi:hypothetical protein